MIDCSGNLTPKQPDIQTRDSAPSACAEGRAGGQAKDRRLSRAAHTQRWARESDARARDGSALRRHIGGRSSCSRVSIADEGARERRTTRAPGLAFSTGPWFRDARGVVVEARGSPRRSPRARVSVGVDATKGWDWSCAPSEHALQTRQYSQPNRAQPMGAEYLGADRYDAATSEPSAG